eukprot:g3267.t1
MTQFLSRRVADEDLHSVLLPEGMDAPALVPLPEDIDYLARQFGYSLLNVSPTDIEKLRIAADRDDSEAIAALLKRPPENVYSRRNEPDEITIEYSQQSFFEVAVREFKTEWVEFFLKKIIDKSIPFEAAAQMMKHNFNALWTNYRTSLEPMLKKDVLGRDICTIQVPIETFTVEANIRTRIGTCNSITEWTDSAQEETALEHWQSLNKKEVDRMMKRTVGRTVEANLRVFCFEDVCRVGLDGIIRFLLMTKAPSSVFKCPLIKSLIVFKWTRIWKLRALKGFLFYLIFLVIVNLILLGISFDMFRSFSNIKRFVFALSVSILMMILAITTLWGEFSQLNRYSSYIAISCKMSLRSYQRFLFRGILAQQYYECTSKLKDLDNIKDNFGTPIKSILTMGYAMVGLFDPGVLLHCGNMSMLAIAIFVLYLALQSIVMFNLLIAAMGDAFDGLRVAEEESFLMARAEFIDQYEALLGQKAIRTIEGKIGKYLYVLIPKDKRIEKSVTFWKGRMIAIKEDVRKIVHDSHEDITQKMEQQTGEISQLTQNINKMFRLLRDDVQSFKDDVKGDIKGLEEKIKTLKERFGDQGSS